MGMIHVHVISLINWIVQLIATFNFLTTSSQTTRRKHLFLFSWQIYVDELKRINELIRFHKKRKKNSKRYVRGFK